MKNETDDKNYMRYLELILKLRRHKKLTDEEMFFVSYYYNIREVLKETPPR